MKFSVILPVYNSEEYLRKCIDSIVTQNYDSYELILVDDGSTDSSREICGEYANKYATVTLICQDNSGPSVARNRGIDCAKGEYITFVDSDDWVTCDYFKTLEKELEEKTDILFFGTGHLSGVTEEARAFPAISIVGNKEITGYIAENYLCGDICSAANKVFSGRLLGEKVRFPEGTYVEEDLQFVLSAVDRADSLKSISAVLYCYNQRESGSITTKYNPSKFDCKCMAYNAELVIAEKWGRKRLEEIFHDNYLSYVSACINNLLYDACPMTRREKLNEIRRFFEADETKSCISKCKGLSVRSKVMYVLIKLKLYRVSYLLHCAVFHMRRR